jgi:uncharacterized protein (TIGR03083 family)
MKPPQPIVVVDLFQPTLEALLDLLGSLTADEWNTPVSGGWTVKEVAQHLLGGEVGILSRKRDGYTLAEAPIDDWQELVALINELNATWVAATQRVSPRLLRDLLAFTGPQVCAYFASLDPHAIGGPVSWAGPEPAPVWLDLAREYTERWHHQQQIRDALGRPGLKQARFFAPALDTFVRALPHTYREVDAAPGTLVALRITGDAGGAWFLRRQAGAWQLGLDSDSAPDAELMIDQETAWRLFTRGISAGAARAIATVRGDQALGLKALEMVSVIA